MMSKMLGPDGKVDADGYLRHVSETAKHEARQKQVTELLPALKKVVERHASIIQQEQHKLTSTFHRINNIESDQAALLHEMEKLRKGMKANNAYWKGLSQGLQETKKTVHNEGDGAMLPSASNIRNLPPLTM